MADQTQVVPTPDASKAIQDLLGLSTLLTQLADILKAVFMSQEFKTSMMEVISSESTKDTLKSAVSSGMRGVTSDEDYLRLVVSVITDSVTESLLTMIKKTSADAEAQAGFQRVVTALCSNESFQGVVSGGVYAGGKRMLEDATVQRNIANVCAMTLADQKMQNMVTAAVSDTGKAQRDFFKGEEFRRVLTEIGDANVAAVKDVVNVSISEAVEQIKGIKFSLSGSME